MLFFVMVTINIGRKEAIFLFSLVVVLVGFGIVMSQNPGVFGHTYDDLQGVASSCSTEPTNPDCMGLPGGWDVGKVATKAGRSLLSQVSENSNRLGGKTLPEVLASGSDRNLRVGSHVQAVNGKYVTHQISFSPACPGLNYIVFLTTRPMDNPPTRSLFIPFFERVINEGTFEYHLADIELNSFSGNVRVNYLVYCN